MWSDAQFDAVREEKIANCDVFLETALDGPTATP